MAQPPAARMLRNGRKSSDADRCCMPVTAPAAFMDQQVRSGKKSPMPLKYNDIFGSNVALTYTRHAFRMRESSKKGDRLLANGGNSVPPGDIANVTILKTLSKRIIHHKRIGISQMPKNVAKKEESKPGDARDADSAINERLVELLRANAIKPAPVVEPSATVRNAGFFRETYALLGLVGLMIVAYVYSLLIDKEA